MDSVGLDKNESFTQQQLDRFKSLTDAVNNKTLTMNKSYKIACQSFEGSDGGVIEGFKGQIQDWINHAKSKGWIDKEGHLVENWSNAESKSSVAPISPIVKSDNKLMTIGVLALATFVLYKTLKK